MAFNSSGGMPRYMQVKLALRREIVEGPLAPGALLPSERLLCERFGVSNITVRRALRDLVHDGLIYRENGVRLIAVRFRATGSAADRARQSVSLPAPYRVEWAGR